MMGNWGGALVPGFSKLAILASGACPIVSVSESNRHPMNHATVTLGIPFSNTL
jgi:hypothetical protein